MLDFFIRFGALVVSIFIGGFAWIAWGIGSPPAWSLLSARAEFTVTGSTVEVVRPGGGRTTYAPRVELASAAGPVTVRGLLPPFTPPRESTAQKIVDTYPVGKTVTVRLVDGVPMADRTDIFTVGIASFLSLFSLGFFALGLFVAFMLGRKRASTISR